MKRMEVTLELRDRIANLLLARSGGWMQPIREMPEEKAQGDAEAILSVLGLDDWDAFVGRMADAHERFWGSPRNRYEFQAAILKVALTATGEGEASDG